MNQTPVDANTVIDNLLRQIAELSRDLAIARALSCTHTVEPE